MNLENPWVQFGIHVFVGTMAGGLSDTVAVWMLFNPKQKKFGIQGAIPKNQARLAKSLGRTVGERLLTSGDLQRELARPELLAAFQSRLEDVITTILTSREPLIDKVPPAVVAALEGATTSYLPVAMTKLGAFLGQPGTRVKLRGALHAMFNRFVEDMRFHERLFAKLMMTEQKFEAVLDAIETDGVEQVVGLLEEPEIREEISRAIHDAILTYLQKPISDILGDVEAKKDPDAPRRLAATAAPAIWAWIDEQIPEMVKKLDVQSMVERKVMAFSVDRVEEILRNVIQNELNLIITTGYVLGGLIGVCTFGLQKLLGL
ncbi:MAG: hypothetical protein DMD72_12030 [Gemmatimonadetes bacterium]|nr:MAG: hypothetical protein DMD72_12030 [Gemmatimonadota bacterium]